LSLHQQLQFALNHIAIPTNKGKNNSDLEAVHWHSKRGVSATSPRRSGRGTTGTTPAAAVTGTGGTAADAVSDIVVATAAVNKSSKRSRRIAVFDAAASTTVLINAKSSAHSQPTATFSGHRQASINSGRNLDIHDAASLPVPSIQDTDNISEYISSEDDSSMYFMTIKKKTTSKNQKKTRPQRRTVNHLLDALLLLPHWLT